MGIAKIDVKVQYISVKEEPSQKTTSENISMVDTWIDISDFAFQFAIVFTQRLIVYNVDHTEYHEHGFIA